MRCWNFTTRIVAATVAIAGLGTFVSLSQGVEPSSARLAWNDSGSGLKKADARRPVGVFVGTSGCTAVSCHGNASNTKHSQTGLTHSEHSVWLQSDKHADAYNVLFNDVSVRMAKALNLKTYAHEAMLCLNCHAPVSEAPFPATLAESHRNMVTDGVSCEACHGGASGWLNAHIQSDWKTKTADQKAALGYRDTKDLWVRGKVCADCHVGAAGRDVNHDLYAAGHPRLSFELSAFHALMPAHWDRNLDRARANGLEVKDRNAVSKVGQSSLEAKLWSIGQIASADTAIDLLRARAATAVPENFPAKYPSDKAIGAWPELAETGCYACHHTLSSPSWRQSQERYSSRRPGGSPWGTWLFPLVSHAASLSGVEMRAEGDHFAKLTFEMAKPLPDTKLVNEHGQALQVRLKLIGKSLNTKSPSADELAKLFLKVAGDGGSLSQQSWDEATQVYLSLVALERAHRDVAKLDGSQHIKGLRDLRSILEFESDFDSPQKFGAAAITQTSGISRSHGDLEKILNQIKTAFEQKP